MPPVPVPCASRPARHARELPAAETPGCHSKSPCFGPGKPDAGRAVALATGLVIGPAPGPAAGEGPTAGLSRAEVTRQVALLSALGRTMFRDPSLSASGRLACASCHSPERAFGPPNALAVQLGGDMRQPGLRAVPSLRYLQATPPFTEHFFESEDEADESVDNGPTGGLTWDGRVDRGPDQARIPLLSPLRDGQRQPARGRPARARGRLRRGPARRSSATRSWPTTERTFDGILKAFEVFEQDWRDLLSLLEQVRRLPRRQGDADARRSGAGSTSSRTRPRATAPAATSAGAASTARRRSSPTSA